MSTTRNSLYPFVELEFAHAIGPGAGRYAVTLDEDDDATGERDVLQIHVVSGPVATPRLFRRSKPAASGDAVAEVPVVRVMWIGASQPLTASSARDEVGRLRDDEGAREELVGAVLRMLNLAVRAHRAAAQDPYLPELSREDPRAVRFGVGDAGQLTRGEWVEAFVAPAPRVERVDRALRIAPSETVALALRNRLQLLETEELVLRARLDADQGRWRGATLELSAALRLLGVELAAIREAGVACPFDEDELLTRRDRVDALCDLALADELDDVARSEVASHIERVAEALSDWRTPAVAHA